MTKATAQCPTVADNTQSFCDLQSPTVSSLVATNNGGGIVWYANATGGTALNGSTGLVNGEDYWADSTAGCGARVQVTVTIYSAPAGLSFQGVCVGDAGDAQINDLQAIGNNVQWFTAPSGGTPLPGTTQLVDSTIYYASQTNPDTGCESSRLSVFVNVGVVPTPTGPPIQQFCNTSSPTIADLVASGVNNWYPTSTSAVQLPTSTPLVNGQSYFATTVDPPCESQSRLEVTVQLLAPNNSGTNGTRGICSNQVATTPPFNLFALLGGTPGNTGTWTGPIATTNGSLGTVNPSTMTQGGSPYVFTYTVNNGVCAASSSTVTVNILPLPTAIVLGSTTICSGSNALITFSGTPNATVTYTVTGTPGNQTIVLNGSGSASLSGSYTSTTTITLVSVASSGTPSCSQALTGSATITVLPLPTASIASNVSICSGGSATVTFTGTPNATVTYNNGSGNQTIILNGSGTATITNTYTSTTTFTLVSVASSGSPSCSRPLTGSATITVIQPPTATIANNASVCPNGSATITFTGTPNATVTYTVTGTPGNQTIVLNGSGTATITQNYASTTTYTLVSVATGGTPVCSRPVAGSVTITVLPLPTAAISANATICSGGNATVTFTGTPNATVTYTATGTPGNQTIVLNAAGTATVSATYTATTTYTLVSVASSGTPSCSQPATGSVTITVIPPPTVAISSNATICSGQSATITFTGTPNATVTYNTGGGNQTIVLNAAGTAAITNTYTATTTFTLVSVATAGTPVCSRPVTGSVTITVVPPPAVAISINSTTVCSGSTATVTFTGTPNATVTYTVTGTPGNQTIVLNAAGTAAITGTYTATTTYTLVSVATSGTPSCSQPAAGSVTVTVIPPPTVTIASNATVCSGGSATVTFTGTPNATVTYTVTGTPGNQTIVLNAAGTATITGTFTSTTTYTLVSVTTSGTPSCTRPATGTVTIAVQPLPTASISANATICQGGSATVTFTGTPNATVTYNNGTGNQTIVLNAAGTATITNTYTASTTFTLVSVTSAGSPGCTAPASGSITITVITPPTVAISSNATVCSGGSATVTFTGTPNATITYTVTGTPGNQTIVLNAAGTATITGTYTATTTFTLVSAATAGTPSCTQPASGSVTITVIPPPTAAITANATVCSGGSATVTFTGTPNATVTYTVTGTPGNQTIVLNAAGTATITGAFTSTTTYTLVSVATSGTPGCTAPATGSITITVIPPPTVAITANSTICSGGSATVTFTGTPNATVTYNNGSGNQTIVLNAAGTATITGTYTSTTTFTLVSITTSGTPSCSQPAAGSVTITVVPPPTVTIASSATVCTGGSATVTFTGTPNATVTYTVTGTPGNQTIVLNAAGTATITGTFASTTTYTLVSVATSGTPSCSQPATGTITITVQPPPTAAISANATICSGGSAAVTFTGTPNSTVTYTTGTGNQTIVLNAAGTATVTNTYTTSTTFTLVSVTSAGATGCTAPATGSVTITVIPPPTVTISSNTTICTSGSATVTFTGTPNATVTYTTGGPNQTIILNASGTATITNTYTATTTFTLVNIITSGTPACTQPAAGSITVTVVPPPTASISSSTTVCSGGSATVTFTGTPNATVTYTVTGTPGNQTIVLDATGTATVTGTFTTDTTYTLASVATGGTPGCSAAASGTMTITVAPLPIAGISGNATVCSGGSATVTFSGTPNATVTYNTGGGNQTVVLDASGTAAITGTYTTTTTFNLVSVATTVTPACSQPQTGSVTVTVIPPPTVTISAASFTVCSGSNATINFTGTPNATVTYTDGSGNQTIVLDAAGTASVSVPINATTVYALVSAATSGTPSCSAPQTGSVTVTATQPPVAGNDVSNLQLCSNGIPVDLFTLLGASAEPGGTWSPALASGTGVFNPTADAAGTYIYTVAGNIPCPDDTAAVTVSLLPPPIAGNDAVLNICTTEPALDLFTLLGASAQAGGTWSPALSSGTGVFNPEVDTAAIYTYTVTGVAPCGNDTAMVEVTVNQGSDAGQNGSVTFCINDSPQDLFNSLGGTPQTGGTWTPALASGTGVFNPAVDTAGVYTYTTLSNACPDDTATVTVTVALPSNAGNDATLNICSNADAQDLFALLGTSAQTGGSWSPALADGTGIFNPSVDAAGTYTYTVTGTPACGNDSATVTVVVTPGSDAGQDGTLTLCINSTSQDLFDSLEGTPMVGGTWTPALASGTGVFNPAVDAAGVYTYTFFGNQPCDNDTATVTVTVNPIPDAGTSGAAFFCSNHAPADLFASLGGTPQPGGTWSPALASGTGVFNPGIDAAGIYTYTVGGGFCSTSTATVTVSVTQAPNAGGAGATLLIDTCITATSIDLFTALNGSQDAGGIWTDDNNAAVSNIFNPSSVAAGTYHFTYTVTGGTSPCLSDTATVTVIVAPIASAGNATAPANVCASSGTFDLFALLDNEQPGGVWTNDGGDIMINPIDISGFAEGTYFFTYTVTNACGTDGQAVQLNILPNPALVIPNVNLVTTICAGESATITLPGTTDGNYTLTYDLTGSNVLAGQTVNVTMAGGSGTFTIPAASIPNAGTTTATFTNITNTVTNCSGVVSGVIVSITVRPLATFAGSQLTPADFCLGNDLVVAFSNASGLPDGSYTLNYTIPGATPSTGTVTAVVATGAGFITIPAASFTTAGSYTITITGITSQSGGCNNPNESTAANFTVYGFPNTDGATVSAGSTCIGFANQVTIAGAANLTDGTYTLAYQLSGANTATNTIQVNFVSGNAVFTIPATDLANGGDTMLTILSLSTTTSPCAASGTNFNAITFPVSQLPTPVLLPSGDEFCAADRPTIAQLSANVSGSEPVTWYDAATGGTAYASSDLLQNGVTYYATYTAASGCESGVRLAVTADLTVCDDITIPDGFSPNGDGINDDFEIINLPELYPRFTLEIYNRYGNILYKGNINTPNWDGKSHEGGVKMGGDLPVGVYFFILEFNDGIRQPIQGRVYLSR